MRSDDEIRKLATAGFHNNLNDLEQDRWLEIATPDELEVSKKSAFRMGHPKQVAMITAELHRRVERDRHEKVIERLGVLDQSVKRLDRKEWKTIVFWIVIASFFVATAALLRDVVDWTIFGLGRLESMHQHPESDTQPLIPQPDTKAALSPSPPRQSADPHP
jgi:hypothetical protein